MLIAPDIHAAGTQAGLGDRRKRRLHMRTGRLMTTALPRTPQAQQLPRRRLRPRTRPHTRPLAGTLGLMCPALRALARLGLPDARVPSSLWGHLRPRQSGSAP
jgi:hypothetical protein